MQKSRPILYIGAESIYLSLGHLVWLQPLGSKSGGHCLHLCLLGLESWVGRSLQLKLKHHIFTLAMDLFQSLFARLSHLNLPLQGVMQGLTFWSCRWPSSLVACLFLACEISSVYMSLWLEVHQASFGVAPLHCNFQIPFAILGKFSQDGFELCRFHRQMQQLSNLEP